MRWKKFEKPLVVEGLQFQVKPEMVDDFIELDYRLWTRGLEKYPGFAGKDVWVSSTRPDEVVTLIYWEDWESLEAVDEQTVISIEREFQQQFGAENFQLVKEWHKENLYLKVAEYY